MAHLTPLAALDAALIQSRTDHEARVRAMAGLPDAERFVAYDASELTLTCEVDAAHAVYGLACASAARWAVTCDRAAYEARHGTLDGHPAWRSEDIASARAEMMESA